MALFAELGLLKVIVKPNGPVWKEESAHVDTIVCQNLALETAKYFDKSMKGNLQFFNKRVQMVHTYDNGINFYDFGIIPGHLLPCNNMFQQVVDKELSHVLTIIPISTVSSMAEEICTPGGCSCPFFHCTLFCNRLSNGPVCSLQWVWEKRRSSCLRV